MNDVSKPDGFEHYNTPHWEAMGDLEHQVVDGCSFKDRIQKEVGLAIEHGELDLKPGDKVLDLASGTADHAIEIAKRTGAHVEAREPAEKLREIAEGKISSAHEGIAGEIREAIDVNVADGNYLNAKESVGQEEQFKCVTCFGTSFIYLKDHAQYMEALKNMHDVIQPGGKLVLQWREKRPIENRYQGSPEWCRENGYEMKPLPEGKKDALGRNALGEMIWSQKGGEEGKGFGMYITDGQGPEDVQPYSDMENKAHGFAFGRVYVDSEGKETPVETTSGLDYLSTENFPLMKRMLEETGFTNVRLIPDPSKMDGINLSVDGHRRLYAITADKL